MKSLKFIAILLMPFCTIAQFDDDVVNYEIIKDPGDINFFGGGVHIMSLELNGYSSPIRIGGEAYGSFGPVYFGIRALIGEELKGTSDPMFGVRSIYGNGGCKYIEYNAGYAFSSKKTRKDGKIGIKQKRNTRYYIKIPITHVINYAADISINKGISPYIARTEKFLGKPVGSDQAMAIPTSDAIVETFMNYAVLNIGVSKIIKTNITINTEKYGQKKKSSYTKLYARLSFPVMMEFDDVTVQAPGGGYFQFELAESTGMKNMGFNIGVTDLSPNSFGMMTFAEFGLFPGPKTGIANVYLNAGFGFNIAKGLTRNP